MWRCTATLLAMWTSPTSWSRTAANIRASLRIELENWPIQHGSTYMVGGFYAFSCSVLRSEGLKTSKIASWSFVVRRRCFDIWMCYEAKLHADIGTDHFNFYVWMIWVCVCVYVSSGCIFFILAWLMEPQHDRRKCRKDGHIPPLVENYIICGSWSVSEQPTNVDDKSLRLDRSTRNVNSIQCFTLTFTHIQRHAPASICIIQL